MRRLLTTAVLVIVACCGSGCLGGWLHGSWEIVAEPPKQFAWEKETTTVGGGDAVGSVSAHSGSGVVTVTRERGQ